jgi:hypothetical protein
MSSVAPAAPQPSQPALSEGARIVDTFVAPTKTFTDLNRKASWFVPWLLMAIVGLGMAFAMGQKVGWKQLNDNQLRMRPKQAAQMEQLPPDQRAQREAIGANITKYISYGIPVVSLIFLVVVAAVLLFSFNFGAGAQLKFNSVLAVVMYASLVGVIKTILAMVFLYAGLVAPDTFIPQNPIGSNLGVLATPGTALYALLSAVDVFAIWTMALTAIGITCISKIKKGTAFGIVFGWYILVTLIGAGFAAAFS